MIKTYEGFSNHLDELIRIRSANYANTDCNIDTLIEQAYQDIQAEVLLEVKRQEYTVDDEQTITLINSNAVDGDNSNLTELYEDVLDIVDENDDFMVINKPSGITVHPGVGNTSGTIANYFKGYLT